VHGTHETVNRICDHPDIQAISFVGSNAAGQYIYERGSRSGKRIQVLPSIAAPWPSAASVEAKSAIQLQCSVQRGPATAWTAALQSNAMGLLTCKLVNPSCAPHARPAGPMPVSPECIIPAAVHAGEAVPMVGRVMLHVARRQANLGAKNHAVIMPDANKEATVNALAGAAFGAAGQRCMAISAAVFVGGIGPWKDALVAKAASLKVGPGFRGRTEG